MDISMKIGERIRYYRRRKKISIDTLAEQIHKSKGTVSKYENGQIVIDIQSLYDVASALGVSIDALLYHENPSGTSVIQTNDFELNRVPAFFRGLTQFYYYLYDGRNNKILRCVAEIQAPLSANSYGLSLYMNISDYKYYKDCEHKYTGKLIHYDTISIMLLQNREMEMEQYQAAVPTPYLDADYKLGLAYGLSSRPLMPTAAKVLISKKIQEETQEFEQNLKISKQDIRNLKQYNMLIIT